MIEMRRRFNLNFSLFDLTRTAAIREHDEDANPFTTEQCIIASIDLMLDHEDLKNKPSKQVLICWWSMKHII
jgi:ATP-dependent helicase HepA